MTENTSRLSAALADRYRIERELGQSGGTAQYVHDIEPDGDTPGCLYFLMIAMTDILHPYA